ncbi:unnamed protein product [Sphenostylis stenocarpa]|uniref:Uncharacterized protein n=1 Tax=Sphenostylis stenocarpa TaxID=92480 RepID=A0AA86VM54_9FABA|nr:unnamed protein product [Sphenostylis stenocarpa]
MTIDGLRLGASTGDRVEVTVGAILSVWACIFSAPADEEGIGAGATVAVTRDEGILSTVKVGNGEMRLRREDGGVHGGFGEGETRVKEQWVAVRTRVGAVEPGWSRGFVGFDPEGGAVVTIEESEM